jgi:pimeloyl-ACP methyl ester carboxylesterase
MGATASLMAAATVPDRVRGLALFDPVVLDKAALAAHRAGWPLEGALIEGARKRRRVFASRQAVIDSYRGRGPFRAWSEAMLADYVADGFLETADGQVALACAPEWEVANFGAQAHDSWAAFAASRCPIHILRAEQESTARVDAELAWLTADGRVRVETEPGATHFLPMERPDRLREVLRAMIEAQPGASSSGT